MKVVILGKGVMLANLILGVRDAGFEITGILRYERTVMPKWKIILKDFLKSSPEKTLIDKLKLHEINCKSANSDKFKKEILKLNADVILVGTWREKLKKEIIDLPTIATINVHPSMLPKYRGPNPYIQTILHGESYSGITFHLMDENFDEGPILAQAKIDILPCDTAKDLKEKTVYKARLLCCELLKKLNLGIVEPIKQDNFSASYYPNITGNEKMLDFTKQTSVNIINTIRALHPFLPTYVTCGNFFFITNPYKIKILDIQGKPGQILKKIPKTRTLIVSCNDGKAIKMSGLKLYKLPLLTEFVIRYLV